MVLLNLIAHSFSRQRRLFLLWTASLCVAVSGLLIADIFRNSLTHTLEIQGQSLLTADLEMSARRLLSESEVSAAREVIPTGARFSIMTEMFAMAARQTDSRLASIRFVDDEYPLRGDLLVEHAGVSTAVHARELAPGAAWVAPDVLALLKVHEGDTIKVGEASFVIAGIVRQDPSQTFRFGRIAPRIFVPARDLPATKLLQPGSTFSQSLFAAFAGEPGKVKREIEQRVADPAVQVAIPADLEQGSLRVLSRLMDYLGLTGLVTLCLGWIGVFYLGRRWLALESSAVGVLKCLGMSETDVQGLLLFKLLLILVCGSIGGALLAWFSALSLFPFVQESLLQGFTLAWSWRSSLLLLLVGPVAGLLLLYPAIRGVGRERATRLIHGSASLRTRFSDGLIFVLTSAALFFVLTLAQARSWRVTLIFLGALVATVAIVSALGWMLIRLAALAQTARRAWPLHLALAIWSRRPGVAVLLVLVSAMAGLLSQLIPNIERTLMAELQSPAGAERPALFLFDIQDEQVDPLLEFLQANAMHPVERAPLIRARILKQNGETFERAHEGRFATREEENDSRFRNRGANLSYRETLSSHEQIVAGKPWAELGNTLENAEVSVEEGYADRLGLKLGDTLRFDVQGIEFDARIGSLRAVDWDSFQPNFFMIFRNGVLDPAPKTWIMTLRRAPKLTPAEMQAKISERFSNVTSINVKEALDNLAELFTKLGSGLRMASTVCLALGLFVFLMILLFQLTSTRRDRAQLHLLGLTARELVFLQLVTYEGLAWLGVTLGSVISLAVAAGLTHFAFHSNLVIDWSAMAWIYAAALALTSAGMVLLSRASSRSLSAAELVSD